MHPGGIPLSIIKFSVGTIFAITAFASPPLLAAESSKEIPSWLTVHVGEGDSKIARPVLERARALYQLKTSAGAVRNPCYFAMDATRPNTSSAGKPEPRFYIICESRRSFRAISSGHGSGRALKGVVDFTNERRCVTNFSNALDSNLTAGGAYITGETKSSFKGYYRTSAKHYAVLVRSFIQFDGEGETVNARRRAIGGHEAVTLKNVCLQKNVNSPYANPEGYVPFGTRVDYAGGRSDGCTSWSPSEAQVIVDMIKDNPTTLYIYPSAADIEAVANTLATKHSLSRSGLYWNASCLKEIGAPKFWAKERLEPIIAQYKAAHPVPPPRPPPFCKPSNK
ncbi:hypothetical protein ACWX0K_24985 (plasmid) [Nitrobacteraceae bacterium UC4446_H13]